MAPDLQGEWLSVYTTAAWLQKSKDSLNAHFETVNIGEYKMSESFRYIPLSISNMVHVVTLQASR